jgi:hypothetical protein
MDQKRGSEQKEEEKMEAKEQVYQLREKAKKVWRMID